MGNANLSFVTCALVCVCVRVCVCEAENRVYAKSLFIAVPKNSLCHVTAAGSSARAYNLSSGRLFSSFNFSFNKLSASLVGLLKYLLLLSLLPFTLTRIAINFLSILCCVFGSMTAATVTSPAAAAAVACADDDDW